MQKLGRSLVEVACRDSFEKMRAELSPYVIHVQRAAIFATCAMPQNQDQERRCHTCSAVPRLAQRILDPRTEFAEISIFRCATIHPNRLKVDLLGGLRCG